ncbi:type IV secretion protein Rhs [Chitinispirillum alkaliphilum]|nr:type IV secretion protein Rhs [Chitinispirillum alkaliphilum]
MARPLKTNEQHFHFLCGDLDPDTFWVSEFSGIDRISSLYRFDIRLLSTDANISSDDVVGMPASIFMNRNGEFHPYSGIISNFQFLEKNVDHSIYSVTLVPRAWVLGLNHRTRIFQKMDVVEIVKQVLNDAELDGTYEFLVSKAYPIKEYVVQYNESDLNFICRIMEDAGIWFFFREDFCSHAETRSPGKVETMVITDQSSGFEYITEPSDIPYRSKSGIQELQGGSVVETINTLHYEKRAIPQSVALKGYNYRTPEVDLYGKKIIKSVIKAIIYILTGNPKNMSEVEECSQIEVNRIRSKEVKIQGRGDCSGMRAGHQFCISDHSRDDLNTNFVITQVSHSGNHIQLSNGGEKSYTNNFKGIPFSNAQFYAPDRQTPVPRVNGVITAKVEANKSDYASVDDKGRYKVRMPFDISDCPNSDASKYIRLAQPYSGSDYGFHFPSHEGTEMVCACIDGDPNKPIGLGTVPNANTNSPVTSNNNHQNIIRTAGKNEMVMDDKKGKEAITIFSPRDISITADNNQTQQVKNKQTIQVGSDQFTTIKKNRTEKVEEDSSDEIKKNQKISVGENQSLSIGKNRTVSISEGEAISIEKGRSISIGESLIETVKKDFSHSIGEDYKIDVGNKYQLSAKGVLKLSTKTGMQLKADEQITIKCGKASITLKQNGDITIKGNKIKIEAKSDLKMKGSKIAQN